MNKHIYSQTRKYFSFAIIMAMFLHFVGCVQSTSAPLMGRWELDPDILMKLPPPSPEFPGRISLYRIDIDQESLSVQINVNLEKDNGASTHTSMCTWRLNDKRLFIKNSTGNETSVDAKIHRDGRLELSAHPTSLANMIFSIPTESKDKVARNDLIRNLLSNAEKKIQAPLIFTLKGNANVGQSSSSHKVIK